MSCLANSKTWWKMVVVLMAGLLGNAAIIYSLNQSDGIDWLAGQIVHAQRSSPDVTNLE